MPSKARHVCLMGVILLPLKHLSSNCINSTLFHSVSIEQFLIKSAERSEAHVLKGYIKNCSIVKLYNKVLISTNVNYGWLHNYFKA